MQENNSKKPLKVDEEIRKMREKVSNDSLTPQEEEGFGKLLRGLQIPKYKKPTVTRHDELGQTVFSVPEED